MQDKVWIKWIVFAVVIGAFVGKTISIIADMFLSETWILLVNMIIPACVVIGLMVVLYMYQREKEKML